MLRTAMNFGPREPGFVCVGQSMTIQSFKDEADINILVRRFGLTGVMPQNVRVPLESDFYDIFDYQSAQNAVIEAGKSFMAIPADVRRRFDDDPGKFVEFCLDPKNMDELRKMGLAVPAAEPAVPATPATPA